MVLGQSSPIIAEKRVAICQSLSGTGALRIAAEFLSLYNPGVDVYCSDPTWGNHFTIFGKAGLKTFKYRYLNKVCTPYTASPHTSYPYPSIFVALGVRLDMTIIYKKSLEIIRALISPLAFLEVEIDCITLDLV